MTVEPLTVPSASAQTPIVSVIVDGTGQRPRPRVEPVRRLRQGRRPRLELPPDPRRYYGGTIPGDPTPSTQRIDVRLLALDNVPGLKVISSTGAMSITDVPGGPWASVYVVKVSANNFQLWGSPSVTDCNTDTTGFQPLVVPNPRQVVEFTTAGGDDVNTPAQNVLGVCRPDGSVVHYRGTIEFWDTYVGTRVVNSVLVEQYVRGVIPQRGARQLGCRPERDGGAQGPSRRRTLLRVDAEPELLRRERRRVDALRVDLRFHVVPGLRRSGHPREWHVARRERAGERVHERRRRRDAR